MNQLLSEIRKKDASAFTHGGKFPADDVFSAALFIYLNPEIQDCAWQSGARELRRNRV